MILSATLAIELTPRPVDFLARLSLLSRPQPSLSVSATANSIGRSIKKDGGTMEDASTVAEFKHALRLMRNGYPDDALEFFRYAVEQGKSNPYYLSFLGVCIARAQEKWDEALELCEAALRMKRTEPQLYLNLAEVYASAGRRGEAIDVLDGGVTYCGPDARIRRARSRFGMRGSAILPFLERHHFLNRNLGRLRHSFSQWLLGPENRGRVAQTS